jgi:CDI immunity proteins
MNEQPGFDDDWSLEQIEGDVWGGPASDATDLIARVHRLRRKPIGTLTAEDLRMLSR